jgi:hypothetical protein
MLVLMWLRTASLVAALVLAGCDSFYGVESRTSFSGRVDIRCVDEALASVPDAGHITYQQMEDGYTEILPMQRQVVTVTHLWSYGEDGRNLLQIDRTLDGWGYRNARSSMGVAVPHDEIVRFQPLMLEVNETIQLRCGLPVGNLKAEPVGSTKSQEL